MEESRLVDVCVYPHIFPSGRCIKSDQCAGKPFSIRDGHIVEPIMQVLPCSLPETLFSGYLSMQLERRFFDESNLSFRFSYVDDMHHFGILGIREILPLS